jgi:hypothetical protein
VALPKADATTPAENAAKGRDEVDGTTATKPKFPLLCWVGVLTWGFMVWPRLGTDYGRPWRRETLRSSKARRCSGVGLVIMVKAGMSLAG